MKTYTLTESKLKKLLLDAFIHGTEVEAGETRKSFETWQKEKLASLPTEEVGIKEDDECCPSGNMVEGCVCWNLVNGKGEEDDYVANQIHPKPSASLASHSCTIGNSIQQKGDIADRIQDLYHQLEPCNLKAFLSLWFSYPPQTEKEWMDKINVVLPCTCGEAYKSRGLAAPDCPQCNYAEEIYMLIAPLLNNQQGDAVSDTTEADSSNADHQIKITELREKFFKECVVNNTHVEKVLAHYKDPEGLFEWFKPYLKIPSIDWEGLEKEFLRHCTKQIGWPESYQQIKDTYVNDPLHLINWLKTKLQDYIK